VVATRGFVVPAVTPACDPWNPDQYAKFLHERERPFHDLLALVKPRERMRVVDLGCGTGRLTKLLHERLNARETVGLDRSARMLESARGGEPVPGLRFEVADIEAFSDDIGYDLILSNAALHWIDDHDALFGRLTAGLRAGGQLAVQLPAMHDDASHMVAAELIRISPFKSASGGWQRSQPVLAPDAYARLLFDLGFADPVVRLIVYPHVLASADDVVEWMKGTLLAEYSRHLAPDVFERFVGEYRRRLVARTGDARPFFFPFKRILMWGQRSDA
jgi:trans-aconitate 2-methyltransferase